MPDPLEPDGVFTPGAGPPPLDPANPAHQEAQRTAQQAAAAGSEGGTVTGLADMASGGVEVVASGVDLVEGAGEVLGGAFEGLSSGGEVLGGCAEGCSFVLAAVALLALSGSALAYALFR